MAKELPYFQFEPAQYLTGNIQFCSHEEQGIFINICAIYWQRSCEITKEQLERKFSSDVINRLIIEGVIKCDQKNEISIEFLDEQFISINASKSRLSEAGKKGALQRKQATLKPPLSKAEAPLKQLDKIREDKIIENKEIKAKEMPAAEFEKIIEDNEDDYNWIEQISKRFDFADAYEANQQINYAYRKFIRDNFFAKGLQIYYNDAKHVRNSAVSWYEAIKKRQASEAKRKQVY